MYFFDVITENYYVYSGDDKDKIWDEVEEYLAFPIIKSEEIADELFVTESTIKKHTSSIFAKFDVTNRFELYAKLKKYI